MSRRRTIPTSADTGRVLSPVDVKGVRGRASRPSVECSEDGVPVPTQAQRRALASHLSGYANHFAHTDWRYTRDLGSIRRVAHYDDHLGYDAPHRRARRALRRLLSKDSGPLSEITGDSLRMRWAMARAALRHPHQLPDGVLDNGGVVTAWEETGEYLQYVQPSIGNLISWLLVAPEDDLPDARDRIAAEMLRIEDGYTARIDRGEVKGLSGPARRARTRRRSGERRGVGSR